ncbi:nucleoside hydrolase [Kaistia dalseonensis]|uniref:Purine nucleosidase n=1 Tax=Kaistia dalseonensis TaxID=410840 RepID=A0ABU0H3P8_9HYPH|nr:nucleoside hydrolase [Kaistia dalseonensis]MCX5494345.1 nucleoside hydrolase [Kaistia dalseonensis]MDQ0436926.1 purine nucleosidase [Kaistia dalseonensis]
MPLNEAAKTLWIDTDTGSDDAVALVIAFKYPGIEIAGISVVAGNLGHDKAMQNALYTREICGAEHVPVYVGLGKPLLRAPFHAENVHGIDGMGDIGLPLTGRVPNEGHGIDKMIEAILARPGEITLVTLGPLTNIAVALAREPRIAEAVKHCVIMGGIGDGPGNVTPTAEFNIYADPDAARMVFRSGMKLVMCGWEVSCRYAVVEPEDTAELKRIGGKLGDFCVDIQKCLIEFSTKISGLPGIDLPDPITMAIALDPSLVTKCGDYYVEVVNQEGPTLGQTVVDRKNALGKAPNATVIDVASREGFMNMLRASVTA